MLTVVVSTAVVVTAPGIAVADPGSKGAAIGACAGDGGVDDAAALDVGVESFVISAWGVGTGLAGGNSS